MEELEYVGVYLDDLLVISKGTYEDNLQKLGKVLAKLQEAGLKVNLPKSHLVQTETEYLGYHISRDRIKPQHKKIQGILNLQAPKTLKQLKSLLWMVQYYRDMWPKRSHILAPLTSASSTKNKKKFLWTSTMQRAFNEMKKVIAQETLLAFPDYDKPFQIYTDARKYQLGAVIQQEGKPLAYFSRKLNKTQMRYTTEERELLIIVETLKEFKGMLLGYPIEFFTDYLNLVHETTVKASNRAPRWLCTGEEFGVTTTHIKREKMWWQMP